MIKSTSREVSRPPGFFCCGNRDHGRRIARLPMNETHPQSDEVPELVSKPSRAFMPYPVSTLSPPIVPTDLTSFKTRGISEVERDLQQKLTEIREQYLRAIDHFNWNKLVYEAEIRFEPIVGGVYHLYEMRDRRALSMISPDQWPKSTWPPSGSMWIANGSSLKQGRGSMPRCCSNDDGFLVKDGHLSNSKAFSSWGSQPRSSSAGDIGTGWSG